ncbi:hypothetical protein DFH07DRAFT_738521 [Mycena maculata]|uniref:Uncharacterized protein n=1 Tax=Mycena maculata TaxID=230809 RepID=A0AAD7NK91_9AGAR|nr:hypothetical protein DFH07DRAFT_738521 [Mycena maculata]
MSNIKTRFLVNTSGSGKTRLAFEGLCQNWGFYFVGAIDMNGIGSGDLQRLLSLHIESKTVVHSQDVEENIKITQRCLRRLLLCRLLVFSIFAEHIGTAVEHKKLWLLLQALPRAVYRSDIFSILMTQLFIVEIARER